MIRYFISKRKVQVAVHDRVAAHARVQALRVQRQQRGARGLQQRQRRQQRRHSTGSLRPHDEQRGQRGAREYEADRKRDELALRRAPLWAVDAPSTSLIAAKLLTARPPPTVYLVDDLTAGDAY